MRPVPARPRASSRPLGLLLGLLAGVAACGEGGRPAGRREPATKDSATASSDPLPPVRIGQRTFLSNLPAEDVRLNGEVPVDLHHGAHREAAVLRLEEGAMALVLRPGNEVHFSAAIPPEAFLEFGVWRGRPSRGAVIRLYARVLGQDGEERTVWAERIDHPGVFGARATVEVDLGEHAGKTLVLGSAGPEGDQVPALGSDFPGFVTPTLECEGRWVAPRPSSARNVVVFLVDTLRADHLGVYGYPRGTSPQLDALAGESLVFEQAQSVASWTKPAVASLFTSRYPSEHGASRHGSRLGAGEVTLAQVFGAAGYRTAAIGVNAYVFIPLFDFRRGFDDFLWAVGRGRRLGTTGRSVVDQVTDWIDRNHEEPFLLYVQVVDPHAPYRAPAGFRDGFLADEHPGFVEPGAGFVEEFEERTREETTPAELDALLALYDAEIAFADAELGRLVAHLRRLGIWEETTFVVLSDHGEEFLDHGGWGHGQTLYQEQLRVPLVLKPPRSAGLEPGRIERPVSLLDVAPTLCELAGVDAPETFRGASLLRSRGASAAAGEVLTLHELERSKPAYAVRAGDLKYIRRLEGARHVEELYRLDVDPRETSNLVETFDPERLDELRAVLDAHLRETLPDGVVLEVAGDGTETVVTGRIRARGLVWNARLLEAEGSDALPETAGEEGAELSFRFHLGPDDHRDALVLSLAESDLFELELSADGAALPAARLSFGASRDAREVPLPTELDAASPSLRVDTRPDPLRSDDGLRCRVWNHGGETAALRPTDIEALRALGYLGDE